MTNSTIINSTTNEIFDKRERPIQLEVVIFTITTALISIGCFILYNIRTYLKTKSEGLKTLMNEFYVTLISYWIWEAISMVIGFSVKIFFNEMPWFMALIIGYEFFFVFLFCYLHTLLSLLCNFILIYKPNIVDEIQDAKIITFTK